MQFSIEEYGAYNEQEILNLYKGAGWTDYTNTPAMLKYAYKNSLKILGAYRDEQLIDIIRVVGDGHSVIFIRDILVSPEYQRQSVGRALVRQILQDYRHVYQIHLLTEDTVQTIMFYKSPGFTMDMGCRAFSICF